MTDLLSCIGSGPKRYRRIICLMSVFVACLVILSVGMYAIRARATARTARLRGQLSQVWLLLQNYIVVHDELPPLDIKPAGSNHLHSWRLAVLTSAAKFDRDLAELIQNYRFGDSWKSANNLAIARTIHQGQSRYFIPEDRFGVPIQILAVRGSRGVWKNSGPTSAAELRRSSNLAVLAAVPGVSVGLFEPKDITQDELNALVTSGERIVVLQADGTIVNWAIETQ
ncbi:MAG: hypothetical protein V4719_12635 [Planctomycetota bacterium]